MTEMERIAAGELARRPLPVLFGTPYQPHSPSLDTTGEHLQDLTHKCVAEVAVGARETTVSAGKGVQDRLSAGRASSSCDLPRARRISILKTEGSHYPHPDGCT